MPHNRREDRKLPDALYYDDLHLTRRQGESYFHTPFIPPFAADNRKLAQVLLTHAWKYVHPGTACPADCDYKSLKAAATKRAIESTQTSVAAIRSAGGYMELQAAIVYKNWRLGIEAKQIAKELGLTSPQVRQITRRIRATASRLGFDTGKRHHSLRRPH
jgi:hypothetical protein